MDGACRGGYLNLSVASRKADSISLGNEVLTCQDVYCEPWLLHHFKEKETKSCCCRQLLQTSTKSHSRICCFSSPAPDTTQRSMRPDSAHKLEKTEGGKRLCTSTAPQCLAFCRLEAACQHLWAAKKTYSESIHPSGQDYSLLNT